MDSTPSQPSDYDFTFRVDVVAKVLPAPASIPPTTSASEGACLLKYLAGLVPASTPLPPHLQLSTTERQCLMNFLAGLKSASIIPTPIVSTTEQTPTVQLDVRLYTQPIALPDPVHRGFSQEPSDTWHSYTPTHTDTPSLNSEEPSDDEHSDTHTRTPSPEYQFRSNNISIIVDFYVWERPEDVKEVRCSCFTFMFKPSDMTRKFHNIEEFVREKIMPAKPPNIEFKPLPTDQIRLASTVKTVRKILRPQWIEGLDGVLDFSIAELLEKITTEFSIVFVREKTLDRAEGERRMTSRSQSSKRARTSASSDRQAQRRRV